MQKSTTWTIVIIVILVALGVILLSVSKNEVSPEGTVPANEEEAVIPEGTAGETQGENTTEVVEAVVPGASPVSEEGEVLTPSGTPVDNTALPGSPEAPKQTNSLSESEIPEEAVKLTMTAEGISPNEFTVKANQAVTLSVTSGDRTHVFKFDDPTLQAVAIGIAGGETRAITFKAPSAGDYSFYCDVPGHRSRGETGVMHVK